MQIKVAIVMGSDSDWRVMKKAKEVLDAFEIPSICKVVSAHRTPEDISPFLSDSEKSGAKIIIAGAGGAAHLAGVLASYTLLPVIGVPINSTPLNGMDSLLSIVQMPEGIPVATVGIDNAGNAALLAIRILASTEPSILNRLTAHKAEMVSKTRKKSENLT